MQVLLAQRSNPPPIKKLRKMVLAVFRWVLKVLDTLIIISYFQEM